MPCGHQRSGIVRVPTLSQQETRTLSFDTKIQLEKPPWKRALWILHSNDKLCSQFCWKDIPASNPDHRIKINVIWPKEHSKVMSHGNPSELWISKLINERGMCGLAGKSYKLINERGICGLAGKSYKLSIHQQMLSCLESLHWLVKGRCGYQYQQKQQTITWKAKAWMLCAKENN